VLDRGFDIQPQHREGLKPYDKDDDKRIGRDEFDAMPGGVQFLIRGAIRTKVAEALSPGK
jgi:hypothetical protein